MKAPEMQIASWRQRRTYPCAWMMMEKNWSGSTFDIHRVRRGPGEKSPILRKDHGGEKRPLTLTAYLLGDIRKSGPEKHKNL